MFETLPYAKSKQVPDRPEVPPIYLYGLASCEHCKEGRDLLEEQRIPFEMVYLDTLDAEVRRPVLQEFRQRYGERVPYPVLEIDGEFIFGFDREQWLERLGSLA